MLPLNKSKKSSTLSYLVESVLPVVAVLLANVGFIFLIYFNQYQLDWDRITYLNISLSVIILFFFFYLLYRSLKAPKNIVHLEEADLPTVSLILPVFNEEKYIFKVLESIAASDYPMEKFELIVVNDGSTDQTLLEIQRFLAQFQGDALLINFPINQGKKAGLVVGFKKAKNEVIVTIDSDTFLLPDSIKKLLSQMDESVDAICGHTLVKNQKTNLLTKIQAFEYLISHQLFKAFEGVYDGVLCCPGCFSAYRKSAILLVLDEFERSLIFNYKVDYGEDRYLTALLLFNQKKVVYSDEAVAFTIVPQNLSSFIIQRKRWIKSWFVNTLYLFRVVGMKKLVYQLYFYLSFIFNLLITSSLPLFIYFIFTANWNFLFHGLYMIFLYFIFILLKQGKIRLLMPLLFYLFTLLIYTWLVPLAIGNVSDHRWGRRAK